MALPAKNQHRNQTAALLVLEDGRTFRGESFGAEGETFGEAVFSTGMTGYQETLTDPSYHRQVVVMTAPHVGNTGMNDEDREMALQMRALSRFLRGVVHDLKGPLNTMTLNLVTQTRP